MPPKPAEVLFTRYTLGDLQLKNRIVMAPLTRTRLTRRFGQANMCTGEWLVTSYRTCFSCGRWQTLPELYVRIDSSLTAQAM